MSSGHVTVRIFGEDYPLRTQEPADRIEELARFVDTRMREIAASGKVVSTSKIAVLAALHIADELFALREGRASAEASGEATARISAMITSLDRALSPPGTE